MRLHDKLDLAGHGIDRVHHIIIFFEVKSCCRLRHKKSLVCIDGRLRIDVQNTFLCRIHLVLADRAVRRDDLTVQVREAYLVVIDQIQRSDTAPRQRFHNIASHAADPKYRNTGTLQSLNPVSPHQKLRPRKLICHTCPPIVRCMLPI